MTEKAKFSYKTFPIKNQQGKTIFTIKQIGGKSQIFIGDRRVMACRFLPIPIPKKDLKEYKNIDSINDLIDQMDQSLEGKKWFSAEYDDLDFFANCSNVEAWVLHDFDTRVLDYRLSFPLLAEAAGQGDPIAAQRLKEEIVVRYQRGNEELREYLEGFIEDHLSSEEIYTMLHDKLLEEERGALIEIRDLSLKRKTHCIPIIKHDHAEELIISFESNLTDEEILRFQKLTCKLKFLKILRLDFEHVPGEKLPELIPELGCLDKLELLTLAELNIDHLFDADNPFPALKQLRSYVSATIGKLKSLEELETWGKNGEGLPDSLGELRNLKKLTINGQVRTLPDSIGNLENLAEIDIGNNELEHLPESFGNLRNLTKLTIQFGSGKQECKLSSLPDTFGDLKDLKELAITKCHLEQLPPSFKDLNSLEKVNMSENYLENLPSSFSKLTNLKYLNLSKNNFTKFPMEITSLKNLEVLILDQNQLAMIPEEIGNLKNLRWLDLGFNKITILPKTIGDLETLTSLSLTTNELTALPESIVNLKRLEEISLGGNKIKEIPKMICKLLSLRRIWLSGNPIEEIPECFKKLEYLEGITVTKTQIPPEKMEYYKKHFAPVKMTDKFVDTIWKKKK